MNTPVFAKRSLYLYDLYHNETQFYHYFTSAPELENDISTPAPAGQKPPELWQVSGLWPSGAQP